jgi:hypothetical protein
MNEGSDISLSRLLTARLARKVWCEGQASERAPPTLTARSRGIRDTKRAAWRGDAMSRPARRGELDL